MSTTAFPYLAPEELKEAEETSTAKELAWLLDTLQECLASLKTGLEECCALLAPVEPGSTLVLSSPRSEAVKGHVTRVGDAVVRGTIRLRLHTSAPLTLSLSPTSPLQLPQLTHLRHLLNQSLDCIDITRWTGDRHSASFISSQTLLLHTIILESLSILKHHFPATPQNIPQWTVSPPAVETYTPELPPGLNLDFSIQDSSVFLVVRTLEPAAKELNFGSKLAFAIGAQRRIEHDEMDSVFSVRGEEVRVREKVGVVSSADPGLLSLGAKLGALERSVGGMRECLRAVMGGEGDDDLE